jgi:hypothetical protein
MEPNAHQTLTCIWANFPRSSLHAFLTQAPPRIPTALTVYCPTEPMVPLPKTRSSHLHLVQVLELHILRSKWDQVVVTHRQLRLLLPHNTHSRPPCATNSFHQILSQEPRTPILQVYHIKHTSTSITVLDSQQTLLPHLSLKHQEFQSVKSASHKTSKTVTSSESRL